MLFTFKRGEEGRERICVGDVCVATMFEGTGHARSWSWRPVAETTAIDTRHINDAIERADEAGFWERRMPRNPFCGPFFVHDEIAVDVPVADNAVLSVTTGEDQS